MLRRGATLEAAAWHDVEPQSARPDPGSRRRGSDVGALPRVGARVDRGAVRAQGDASRGCSAPTACGRSTIAWTRSEKPQPPDYEVQDPGDRRAERQRRARRSATTSAPATTAMPDLSGLRAAVEGGRVKALYVLDPGPDGSLGDVVVDRRRAPERHAAAADRAGRGDDRPQPRPPTSSCPARPTSRRTRSTRTRRATCRPRRASIAPPGEALEDWQILANAGTRARPDSCRTRARTTSAARSRRRCRERRTRRPIGSSSRVRSRRATGCRHRTRRSGGSGTSCTRICRR